MKRIVMIVGDPGAGKTYLANLLKTQHGFCGLSVDDEYVSFVKSECPDLYFEVLSLYIAPHYDCILSHREYSRAKFGRDFLAEWHGHLAKKVASLTALHDSLVVEGYLLKDCTTEIQDPGGAAKVFQVHVRRVASGARVYTQVGSSVSVAQIAALGIEG